MQKHHKNKFISSQIKTIIFHRNKNKFGYMKEVNIALGEHVCSNVVFSTAKYITVNNVTIF